MEKPEIFKTLDILEKANPLSKILATFNINILSKEEEFSILEWFCKNGHIRSYFNMGSHEIYLISNNNLLELLF